MGHLDESIIEDTALEWFGEMGYVVGHPRGAGAYG